MRDGLKKALEIVDGLHQQYQSKLTAAIEREDAKEIAHWQAYFSALSVAALAIEKEMKK